MTLEGDARLTYIRNFFLRLRAKEAGFGNLSVTQRDEEETLSELETSLDAGEDLEDWEARAYEG